MTRLLRAVLAAALALVVAGCTGLPGRTDVGSGRGVDEKLGDGARILAPPPRPGASPEQIVRGFIRAGAAFQEADGSGETVALSYLAPTSQSRWRPTASVTVIDRASSIGVDLSTPGRAVISTVGVAALDEGGRYRELPPDSRVTATLELVQVGQEWRVQLPPEGFGVWLSTDDFSRLFSAYRIHYPILATKRLLADVRWLPTGPRLVTALARAQLGGVPDYLRGTVDTGFPEAARLAVDAVAVESGVARVVLSSPASSADLAHRRQMWAQLSATLLAVPSVSAVSVEVQGSGELPVPEARGPIRSVTDLGYAPSANEPVRWGVQRVGDKLTWVEMSRLDDVDVLPAPTGLAELPSVPAAYPRFVVAPGGQEVAALAVGGAELSRWRGRVKTSVTGVGPGLVDVRYDGLGRLWVAGNPAGAARIWTIDGTRAPDPLEVAWLDGRQIVALAPSRDATRLAVISRGPDGVRLDVAGIQREGEVGRPLALNRPARQADPLVTQLDVDWVDDTTLSVLGAVVATEAARPYVVGLFAGVGLRRIGLSDPGANIAPPVTGARGVVSGNGALGVVVLTDLPSALVRVGATWRRVGQSTTFAVTPVILVAPGTAAG